jgi:hypothetical protein
MLHRIPTYEQPNGSASPQLDVRRETPANP